MQRFHIRHGGKRTTVTLDSPVPELLALSFEVEPDTLEARKVIERWLQKKLDGIDDPGRKRVSQWLRGQAIFHLLDTKISRRYDAWIDSKLG